MKVTTILLILLHTIMIQAEPYIVAHRGASGDAPENTLPAFRLAWEQHADAIEGDFHFTKDQKIICIHDKDTKKVAGVRHMVKDLNLQQLRKLDLGRGMFGKNGKGIHLPTFSEILEVLPEGKKFFVEVKSDAALVPTMLREIQASGLKDEQITVISFNEDVIKAVKEQAPRFKAMWLSGLKKDRDGLMEPSIETVLKTLKEIKADGFSSKGVSFLDGNYINAIKSKGYQYHVWTIDDAAEARRFADLGVDSITTNYPAKIREALKASR